VKMPYCRCVCCALVTSEMASCRFHSSGYEEQIERCFGDVCQHFHVKMSLVLLLFLPDILVSSLDTASLFFYDISKLHTLLLQTFVLFSPVPISP